MINTVEIANYLRSRVGQQNIWFMHSCAYGDEDYNEDTLSTMQQILGASDYAYGATKAVFFFNNNLLEDWVVKIPYHGWFEVNCYDDIEEVYQAAEEYEEFTGALASESWNYCAREAELYEESMFMNLNEFFAATYYVCTIQDIPFYISEKICYNDFNDKDFRIADTGTPYPYQQLQTTAKTLAAKYHVYEIAIEDIIPTLAYCGEDIVEQLFHFCDANRINDLHSANYAVLEDGFLKIFDYSGYDE